MSARVAEKEGSPRRGAFDTVGIDGLQGVFRRPTVLIPNLEDAGYHG